MTTRKSLIERITPEHLAAYNDRSLSTRQIAEIYGLTPEYVVRTLPKREIRNKQADILASQRRLRAVRMEFRDSLARQVVAKTITVEEAAKKAHCTVRNLYRHVKKVRACSKT